MEYISFGGCSAWLHTNLNATASDVAVLVCSGINEDASAAYFFLRVLADQIAAAGYPTLRFDYPGTGDALSVDNESNIWREWRQGVHSAVAQLRHITGAQRVIIAGLRIGATLGILIAEERDDIAGLILLAPVLVGHSYIRGLYVRSKLHQPARLTSNKSFESPGVYWSEDAIQMVQSADLRLSQLRSDQSVVIFAEPTSRYLPECIKAWSRAGAKVTCRSFAHLTPILSPKWDGEARIVPPDLSEIIGWIRTTVPSSTSGATVNLDSAALQLPECIETPIRFGPDRRLFGLLCRHPSSKTETVVIIGNTARDPHFGTARFGVDFARYLATRGIASLRMDYTGLGNSLGIAGEEDVLSAMFEPDRSIDISAAIDALEELGYQRFVVQGLCAGAYHMFHGALADTRISTVLLANLPFFTWHGEGNNPISAQLKNARLSDQLSKLLKLKSLGLILKGRIDINRHMRAQIAAFYEQCLRWRRHINGVIGRARPESFAERAMQTLDRRHARTLFLYAEGDLGLNAFQHELGRDVCELRFSRSAVLKVLPSLDHAFSQNYMRQVAAKTMADFISCA